MRAAQATRRSIVQQATGAAGIETTDRSPHGCARNTLEGIPVSHDCELVMQFERAAIVPNYWRSDDSESNYSESNCGTALPRGVRW
jgi:hypothetical protein